MCVELFSLRNKVALVTGAGKGLGKSMALALSESGAHVVVVSRTLSDIEATAREIQENTWLKNKRVRLLTSVPPFEYLAQETRGHIVPARAM